MSARHRLLLGLRRIGARLADDAALHLADSDRLAAALARWQQLPQAARFHPFDDWQGGALDPVFVSTPAHASQPLSAAARPSPSQTGSRSRWQAPSSVAARTRTGQAPAAAPAPRVPVPYVRPTAPRSAAVTRNRLRGSTIGRPVTATSEAVGTPTPIAAASRTLASSPLSAPIAPIAPITVTRPAPMSVHAPLSEHTQTLAQRLQARLALLVPLPGAATAPQSDVNPVPDNSPRNTRSAHPPGTSPVLRPAAPGRAAFGTGLAAAPGEHGRQPGTEASVERQPTRRSATRLTPPFPIATQTSGSEAAQPPRVARPSAAPDPAAPPMAAAALGSAGGGLRPARLRSASSQAATRPAADARPAPVVEPAQTIPPTRDAAPRAASRLLAERVLSPPARPAFAEDPADAFAARLDDALWLEGGE